MADQKKQPEKNSIVRINIGARQTERGPVGDFVELKAMPQKLSDFPEGTIRQIVYKPRTSAAGRIGVITVDGQKFYVADDSQKAKPEAK